MTPSSFKANPDEWRQSNHLDQMLFLLQHLANDGNVTISLLAADFAEATLLKAKYYRVPVERCIVGIRAWARDPTEANLQECKDAANAIAISYARSTPGDFDASAYATAFNASSTVFAKITRAPIYASNAAYFIVELPKLIAHTRAKHPLTEL